MPTTPPPTILFAGGGTGGHIFPSLAVWERLRESHSDLRAHFLVSKRPLDAQICRDNGLDFTPISAAPFSLSPKLMLRNGLACWKGRGEVAQILRKQNAVAMVSSGGFASGPAVSAAAGRVPTALLSLDASPGRANRWMARKATQVFSVYAGSGLPNAKQIAFPLRRGAIGGGDPAAARERLGLAPDRHTLFITAGSQGARTINQMMCELAKRADAAAMFEGWQVLHLTGEADRDAVAAAYDQAGIPAVAQAFCHQMGDAWSAATLAISRAGAGSAAEVLAGAVPTLFFPYPYHKDEHQRLNAAPLVDAGGAVCLTDHIDPAKNLAAALEPLQSLVADGEKRNAMRMSLQQLSPEDGAQSVATWCASQL